MGKYLYVMKNLVLVCHQMRFVIDNMEPLQEIKWNTQLLLG